MNLREPYKQYYDDYEHRVTSKIAKCGNLPGFPQLADYGIDSQDFDGYLFDKQAIMDMGGSQRSQLTVGGIITVLPLLVLASFPDDSYIYGKMWTTLLALFIGLLLALFAFALLKAVIACRLAKMKDVKMETYIKAVLRFEPKES